VGPRTPEGAQQYMYGQMGTRDMFNFVGYDDFSSKSSRVCRRYDRWILITPGVEFASTSLRVVSQLGIPIHHNSEVMESKSFYDILMSKDKAAAFERNRRELCFTARSGR
jgi:hypothetical protein